MWKIDDRVTHRYNTDLGVGRILALEGRNLVVEFVDTNTVLTFGAATDASPWNERELPPRFGQRLAFGDVGPLDAFSVNRRDVPGRVARVHDIGSFLGVASACSTPAGRRPQGDAARPGTLAARRRGWPRQDGRACRSPTTSHARTEHRVVVARNAHRAVARRAVAEVPPGLRAPRRGAPRGRRARFRRRLQPVRGASPCRHRPRYAGRASQADRPGGC